ncbi:MAG: hypothetical protein QXD71_02430 [Candidatus Pacearchaeota archaeon]
MFKNKKAWLLLIEVVVAIVIMFGFLLSAILKQPIKQKIDVNSELDFIVEQANSNETIRSLLLGNPEKAEEELRNKINPRLNLTICQENCVPEINKNIYSTNFILWDGEEKKFIVYVWFKD